MAKIKGWLTGLEYKSITKKVPIPTVDLVILRKVAKYWEVLLLVRKTGYAKGQWCVIGGRVRIDETLKDTMKRQTEDLGVDIKIFPPFDYNFPAILNDHPNQDKTKQPLCAVYPAKIIKGKVKEEGDEYTRYKWFPINKLPKLAYDHEFEVKETFKRLQKFI